MQSDWPSWLYDLARILMRLSPLIAFVAWCLLAVNWRRAWPVLGNGGWVPLVLIGGMAAAVWAFVFPTPHILFGHITVPNGLWQLAAVAVLMCVALLCGWLQTRLGWYPPDISFTPPAPMPLHGHDEPAHPTPATHAAH